MGQRIGVAMAHGEGLLQPFAYFAMFGQSGVPDECGEFREGFAGSGFDVFELIFYGLDTSTIWRPPGCRDRT